MGSISAVLAPLTSGCTRLELSQGVLQDSSRGLLEDDAAAAADSAGALMSGLSDTDMADMISFGTSR
jgi:hypothetical protein